MVGILPVKAVTEQERRQRPATASGCGITACHDGLGRILMLVTREALGWQEYPGSPG
jgi:hypothetical protein